ncbi:MAG: hypothetical protein JO190_10920 [Candidatus Eremiobacteraeota bacterium]|nr:hypothetical protein [Candidatus Eremiobacteraeota bacterium]MBV8499211.1 hypothetical protein [Candidatus Eremiobacteraeota bacterium]
MLAAMLVAALGGALFPAPGTYRYTASMNGQPIGSWSVSVTAGATQTTLDETSSAQVLGMQLAGTASLVLGPDLGPLHYSGRYQTPNQSPSVSVTLSGSSATVVGALTSQPQQLALAANTQRFVVVEPGLLAGLFALPAQMAAWKNPTVTMIIPATVQAQVLTATTSSSSPRPAGLSAQEAVLSIEHPVALTIWYDPATMVPDEVVVPSQNAILTRVR